jgi:hypothetical protein
MVEHMSNILKTDEEFIIELIEKHSTDVFLYLPRYLRHSAKLHNYRSNHWRQWGRQWL